MKNYYEILQVEQESPGAVIKKSFRRLVLRYHPDRNHRRVVWAETQMKLLLDAYSVLRDLDLRREYDEALRHSPEVARKRFWKKWEKRRREDNNPDSSVKLLLRYLLTGRAEKAISLYNELARRFSNIDMSEHLEVRDYLDCMFLLAEEFERSGLPEVALEHYEAIHNHRTGKKNGYLREEVRYRIRNLLLKTLPGKNSDSDAVRWYRRALKMKMSTSDRAFVFKKMAECYARDNKPDNGRRMLERAFKLKPNLKGAKKICRILNVQAG